MLFHIGGYPPNYNKVTKPIIAAYLKKGDLEKIELSPIYKLTLIITTALTILLGIAPDLVKNIF